MSDIDPEKLADAVAYYDRDACPATPQFYAILAAARAHLATLPQYKEVTFARYLVTTARAEYGPFLDESDALALAKRHHDAAIVRLTGTAKVKVA